ncbi:MAG: ABC transporter ATP-binding protein [Clostridia bacterium]|nr:ABC transporter ATP-binding protein [Clostridia bacterium]
MQKKTKSDNLKRLIRYYGPYKGLFFSDMFFAVLGSVITLVIPLIVRYITSEVVSWAAPEALRTIVRLGIVMIALVLLNWGCNFFIGYYGHIMGAKIEHDMRNEIFTHYQKLSFSFFDDQKVGQLLSRVTSDLFDISELLHHGPEDLVISVIRLVGAMAILFSINPQLALVPLGLVIVLAVFAYFLNIRMKKAFTENRRRIADINAQIEDSLSGIRVVKSFGNEKVEIGKFREGNERFVASKKVSYRYMSIYNSGMTAISLLITVVSLIGGGMLMTRGDLTAPDLVAFLLYINNFTDPVKRLVSFTEQFQNGYTGYERFREIMRISPQIQDAPDAVVRRTMEGQVDFDDVSFHYESDPSPVLSHVNLHVKPGEYVALVGASGAGKTTLCSLIPRFYDATEGAVSVDGIDVRKLRQKDLHANIGLVQQDVYLFAGTVMENIRYGMPDATDEDVIRAAKAANAHDFIMQLADGYDTDIGQRGVKLSGGQKQRLSIARVFLKNPPILIFDEATSALDNESERVVQHSLEVLAKDRTTFVIAHRLSTIRNAQRILVLTEDGVAEEGTHEELLAKGGAYAELYGAQF